MFESSPNKLTVKVSVNGIENVMRKWLFLVPPEGRKLANMAKILNMFESCPNKLTNQVSVYALITF